MLIKPSSVSCLPFRFEPHPRCNARLRDWSILKRATFRSARWRSSGGELLIGYRTLVVGLLRRYNAFVFLESCCHNISARPSKSFSWFGQIVESV